MKNYSVDIPGLVLVEQKSDNASVGNLFFLFDGKEFVDGSIEIS
jgi:hypothetical protein